MNTLLVLPSLMLAFVGCVLVKNVSSSQIEQKQQIMINRINQLHDQGKLHWKATNQSRFFGKSITELKFYLGAKSSVRKLDPKPSVAFSAQDQKQTLLKGSVLPSSFDARSQWPHCDWIINDIRDQLQCGSCWAFSTANVISDRICIQSGATVFRKISTEDQIICMNTNINGYPVDSNSDLCQGFSVQAAMGMYQLNGIVTGGEYNQPNVGCMPYFDYSSSNTSSLSECTNACTNTGYGITYRSDKNFGTNIITMGYSMSGTNFDAYIKSRGLPCCGVNYTWSLPDPKTGHLYPIIAPVTDVVTMMQKEIYHSGPISVSFDIYEDFFNYFSGVYQYDGVSSYVGGHAITIIGWGDDNGVPYWLCVNQWNTSWGNDGLINILRGTNEVNIENEVWAVTPKISNSCGSLTTTTTTKPTTTTKRRVG